MINLIRLQQFSRHLASAVSTAGLYPLDHFQVKNLCHAALESLREAMAGEPELSLMCIGEDLVVEGAPVERSMYATRLVRMLKFRGVEHIKFVEGIEESELLALMGSLAEKGTRRTELHSSPHLRLGKVELHHSPSKTSSGSDGVGGTGGGGINQEDLLEDLTEDEIGRLMEIYDAVAHHHKLNIVGISDIVSSFVDAFAGEANPLMAMAHLRDFSEYTFTHSSNVCILNLIQASSLGISGPMLHDIGISAMLHDIGKQFIPDEILTKPTVLTEEEWKLMQLHPVKGAKFLLDTPGIPRLAVVTAYEHHMRFDLNGYPRVASNWEQNFCSHLTTISDMFDAMMTKRSYRNPQELESVLFTVESVIGTQLHPILAENFVSLMRKNPVDDSPS